MQIDPWILTFSALTVIATIWMGFWSARKSKTASDFFVAGRSVSVGWNASAISGEYLSAASFMGVAGMVMSSGYDALWYPVCYACGYLFLLLFIAGPLRRFGAYTIPDFAEGRFDSPVFRKIAVVFVLFIGFFYTMPQMKGAGTTLAYIFPGLPYWAGVVLVGAVITLNVALGGMKGITLVQAFQYWAKMFAISVPIFVLMAVYGHYGKQVGKNGEPMHGSSSSRVSLLFKSAQEIDRALAAASSVPYEPLKWFKANFGLRATNALESVSKAKTFIKHEVGLNTFPIPLTNTTLENYRVAYSYFTDKSVYFRRSDDEQRHFMFDASRFNTASSLASHIEAMLQTNGIAVVSLNETQALFATEKELKTILAAAPSTSDVPQKQDPSPFRQPLPAKAPRDETWLNPFGPLTTKAAKAAAAAIGKKASNTFSAPSSTNANLPARLPDVAELPAFTNHIEAPPMSLAPLPSSQRGTAMAMFLTPRGAIEAAMNPGGLRSSNMPDPAQFKSKSLLLQVGDKHVRVPDAAAQWVFDRMSGAAEKHKATDSSVSPEAWLATHERPLALLYTYSLIIALVCGTAGLPHILVRFYTNPDGAAAKRTTMWVMILIGVFYLFPPVFGVLGRNLLPELYAGLGAKGTDKIVLELPRILNERFGALGSILSGITCAGAFAAFMSTFSGLLVSMTGALAHDVYGRMLNPKSTADQRLRAFKICAVVIGGVAILLGMQVEPLQINFMVGQAFAIAAASYFPLLFMSAWWRGMTMRGAATGMLAGGTLALAGISLTSFTDLKWLPLDGFWATHPLLRILCEQPAIWAVPLAITLMVVVSKLTAKEVPADIRMKMLVLHAPEKLGLKQEYIQEHQTH